MFVLAPTSRDRLARHANTIKQSESDWVCLCHKEATKGFALTILPLLPKAVAKKNRQCWWWMSPRCKGTSNVRFRLPLFRGDVCTSTIDLRKVNRQKLAKLVSGLILTCLCVKANYGKTWQNMCLDGSLPPIKGVTGIGNLHRCCGEHVSRPACGSTEWTRHCGQDSTFCTFLRPHRVTISQLCRQTTEWFVGQTDTRRHIQINKWHTTKMQQVTKNWVRNHLWVAINQYIGKIESIWTEDSTCTERHLTVSPDLLINTIANLWASAGLCLV